MIYIAYFTVGLLGSLFGGIIMGYLFDSWSSGHLEIGDTATWLAAISTLGAAIGTIGSLIMLNRQHKENVALQEKVWKKQEESLDFARYRDHKMQFEQLLDTLENKHKDFYVFANRAKLYSRLFPNNSPRNEFSNYKYKLTIADLTERHPLKIAWKNIDKVDRILRTHSLVRLVKNGTDEDFETYPNPIPIHQFEHPIFITARQLGLKCTRTPRTGDLINTDDVFASVFNPIIMKMHSEDIFESLNEFCGLDSPRTQGVGFNPLTIGFELFYYYRREDVPEFNSIAHGHYNIVDVLFKLDRFVKSFPPEHAFAKFVHSLFGTPWNKVFLNEIENKEKVKNCLNEVTTQLRDIVGQHGCEQDLKRQAQDILDYIKEQE